MLLNPPNILSILKAQAKHLNYAPSVDEDKFYAACSQDYYEIRRLAHPYLAPGSTVLEVGYGYGVSAKCLKTYETSVTSLRVLLALTH